MRTQDLIPLDAWEEPDWCFLADTISETIYKNRHEAGLAITELLSALIDDDVLTSRLVPGQSNLSLLFTFDHDCIVQEQVTAWYENGNTAESYALRWEGKKGSHWRLRNKGLGGYQRTEE